MNVYAHRCISIIKLYYFLSPKRHMKGVWWQKALSEELVDYPMTLYICMVMK